MVANIFFEEFGMYIFERKYLKSYFFKIIAYDYSE